MRPTRWVAATGIVVGDLLSAALAAYPLMFLWLASTPLWVTTSTDDMFDDASPAWWAMSGVVGLAPALLPAVAANVLLGHRAGWPVALRTGVAAAVVVGAAILHVAVRR